MTTVQDLLLLFEWLLNRNPASVDDACARFGLTRAELEAAINTLASIGEAPFSPSDFLEAYVDEDTDTIHVVEYPGFERGISMDLDVARTLYAFADALTHLPGFDEASATRQAAERLGAALAEAGVDLATLRAQLDLPGVDLVSPLRNAIVGKRRIRIQYHSASSGTSTERTVDPIGLVQQRTGWYLDGFDHRRGDRVFFRLDRVEALEVTEEAVVGDYEAATRMEVEQDRATTSVVLRCAPGAAWLADRVPEPTVTRAGDVTTIAFVTTGTRWLVPQLLAAGPGARVEEPSELREQVRAAATAALERYGPTAEVSSAGKKASRRTASSAAGNRTRRRSG